MPVRTARVVVFAAALLGDINSAQAGEPQPTGRATHTVTLHNTEIELDARSGSLLRMSHPGPGVVLETTAEHASLIDLAYPIEVFEPLRLASRYSREAKTLQSAGQVSVHWDRLGPSRSAFDLPGRVSATVTLKAAPDGESIVMTCRVENHSPNRVRQVLFPDLLGLVPLGEPAKTEFRTGPVLARPFVELARPATDRFYAVNPTFAEYTSTGKESTMAGRWLDLSGPGGGLSLFPKRRTWETGPIVMLQYWEVHRRLRLMCVHYVELAEGGVWESGEYWLTPHQGDWSKGIRPYRAWLKESNL
jgi:hypothetical protein